MSQICNFRGKRTLDKDNINNKISNFLLFLRTKLFSPLSPFFQKQIHQKFFRRKFSKVTKAIDESNLQFQRKRKRVAYSFSFSQKILQNFSLSEEKILKKAKQKGSLSLTYLRLPTKKINNKRSNFSATSADTVVFFLSTFSKNQYTKRSPKNVFEDNQSNERVKSAFSSEKDF